MSLAIQDPRFGILSTLGGLLPGPLGTIGQAIGGGIESLLGRDGRAPAPVPTFPRPTGISGIPVLPIQEASPQERCGPREVFIGGKCIDPGAIFPGGDPFISPAAGAAENGANGNGCPAGTHPNKTGYWTKTQGFIPKGSKCVKNRRRNPGNMRATDRAISRVAASKRMARTLGRVTIRPKCPKKCPR